MPPTNTIRLLSADNNKKGDLFTRLSDDVFFILGYGELVRDLAQPGREIDVLGKHRTEHRQMCAECKAHQDKMGGAEVNKFRGALMGEQCKPGAPPTTGYFLSLGGFKDSAWEQEKGHGANGIIFLDAARIIRELEGSENGHFLVTDAKATEQAGRCVQRAGLRDVEVERIEVLGHKLGYIKAVYFAHNKQMTHVALIHADGTPLAIEPANQVIADDKASGGTIHQLQYLSPAPIAPDRQQLEQQALDFYFNWIGGECGYMQLDGLPLDNHKNPIKPHLESLFVPMRARIMVDIPQIDDEFSRQGFIEEFYIPSIGEILSSYKHVALLAAPGGGKSTVLKRLATAYSFEERRQKIKDNLPTEQWLPLFLRCRELRKRTEQPIMQLLESIPAHINMGADQAEGFRTVLHEKLRAGHVLLLVDGLDEITDEGARKGFADNLRRFLVSYPQVGMVVTSRIAGFRIVSGVIGQVCQEAELAPLTQEDIQYICLRWYIESYADSPQVRAKAHKLAEQILANPSIFTLATNPLLLNTLLAVRRNLGELPTNRADLYREAVKLLVRTWNVEGFTPMPERESMAQLCYIACGMMERGIQQIPHELLLDLVIEAREVLSADLQYTRLSPEEFIIQVEYRSSLLIRVGQLRVGSELQDIYEFRHLTFQEFLAAEGYVKRRHKQRRKSLAEILSPHVQDPSWEEVIALATVLADELDAEPLVEMLIADYEQVSIRGVQDVQTSAVILGKCLVDEIAIAPAIFRRALKQLARFVDYPPLLDIIFPLWESRAKDQLEQAVEEGYTTVGGEEHWLDYVEAMRYLSCVSYLGFQPYFAVYEVEEGLPQALDLVLAGLRHADDRVRIKAAFAFIALSNGVRMAVDRGYPELPQECTPEQAQLLFTGLRAMLQSADAPVVLAASLALKNDKLHSGLLASVPIGPEAIMVFFHAWRTAEVQDVAYELATLLLNYAPIRRDALSKAGISGEEYNEFLLAKIEMASPQLASTLEGKAAALMCWYWYEPLSDTELADLLNDLYPVDKAFITRNKVADYKLMTNMLLAMGEAGKQLLEKRNRRLLMLSKMTL